MLIVVVVTTPAALLAQEIPVPAIVGKCESNYRELLSAMEGVPQDRAPRSYQNGRVVTVPPKDWCSGFFAGSLWYMYELTGKQFWRERAIAYTERLIEPLRHDANNHDVGFRTYCSAGNALRLTGEARYADFLHDTAAALRTRYNERAGVICSWDAARNKGTGYFASHCLVIIDNMMNLELLEWDAKHGGAPESHRIACNQANATDRHHFRPDGSSYHILDYNPDTSKINAIYAGQGACVEGVWARGQAWAIYGFTVMYRETRNQRYLDRAIKSAEYWLSAPMPADGVPYWDFKAEKIPNEPRDASAAAIVASAFLELRTYVPPDKSAVYEQTAFRILSSLTSSDYFCQPNECGGFILRHSTGCRPRNVEVDVPLCYADYYLLEALVRLSRDRQ